MKELIKQKTVLYFGLALIIIGGSGAIIRSNEDTAGNSSQDVTATQNTNETTSTITSNADGTIIGYQGEEGRTALEVLKDVAEVITEDSSFGEFVTTINGVEQTDSEFWLFYVNEQPANVGAADYVTKEGDNVEWKLEG